MAGRASPRSHGVASGSQGSPCSDPCLGPALVGGHLTGQGGPGLLTSAPSCPSLLPHTEPSLHEASWGICSITGR